MPSLAFYFKARDADYVNYMLRRADQLLVYMCVYVCVCKLSLMCKKTESNLTFAAAIMHTQSFVHTTYYKMSGKQSI